MSARATLSAVLLAALGATAACSSSASTSAGTGPGRGSTSTGSKPTLRLAYFQGAVAGPDAVIAANADLTSQVDAKISLKPITSGVAGIAQLKTSDISGLSAVGNPPTVAAIGTKTKLKIVYVESIDSAALVVDRTITGVEGLRGKSIGALVGSTLDFAIRGYLKTQNLTNDVRVTPFFSESALDAALKAGKIHAAYLSAAYLNDAVAHGVRRLVESSAIAKSGYAALNLLVFSQSYIDAHRAVVQQVVCQTVKAQALLASTKADPYITKAAGCSG